MFWLVLWSVFDIPCGPCFGIQVNFLAVETTELETKVVQNSYDTLQEELY